MLPPIDVPPVGAPLDGPLLGAAPLEEPQVLPEVPRPLDRPPPGPAGDRPRTVVDRLLPAGSARRLALARALVVGAGLGLWAAAIPVIAFAAGADGPLIFGLTLVLGAPLALLGAAGGAASGVAERLLPARPRWRGLLLAVAPGLVTWLAAMQLAYLIGVARTGVEGGLGGVARMLDPASSAAMNGAAFAVTSGLGVGRALARIVDARLAGAAPREQRGRALRGLLPDGCGAGCGGFAVFAAAFIGFEALGRDPKRSLLIELTAVVWVSSAASILVLGLLVALVGPWLLERADRLAGPASPSPAGDGRDDRAAEHEEHHEQHGDAAADG